MGQKKEANWIKESW